MAWNEERLLPYFFRHYDRWVERYVVYDDNSSDRTLEILHAHPRVEVRRLVRSVPDSFVLSAQALHNRCWKESRGAADWVVITAIDEHLHHPDFEGYLAECSRQGVTAIPALGFDMVADEFPAGDRPLHELVRLGVPSEDMSKLSLFDPNRLSKTRFQPGRHLAIPQGNVRYPAEDRLLNLHFKTLGADYTLARYRLLSKGLGPRDGTRGFGHQYHWPEQRIRELIAARKSAAFDVLAAGEQAAAGYTGPRWWRGP